jgi:NitT/TauT family transport system substrate-binding protein
MQKLILEKTAPFQGLPELVAYDEGLFAAEGLDVAFVEREQNALQATRADVIDPTGLNPFSSHGATFETGGADMYNACEWGNYARVSATKTGSRQLGRRAIIVFAALVVRPDSEVYTPQQLAGKLIGLPYYFGTHYLGILMLEGFVPRDQIRTCQAPNGSRQRYASLLRGEIEATTLTEPYISVAEKAGCRVVSAASFHGTEVAAERVDAETYAAFNRAVQQAVRRINADKQKYLHYFIDYHKADPDVAALSVDDLRTSRLQVVDPGPIPEDEMRHTMAWMQSWNMLDEHATVASLIDAEIQETAQRLVDASGGDG